MWSLLLSGEDTQPPYLQNGNPSPVSEHLLSTHGSLPPEQWEHPPGSSLVHAP